MNKKSSDRAAKGRNQRPDISAGDLARLAGVSKSAISRAFTPGASISSKMRDHILSMAERHGYRPNAIAAMLSRSRSNIVGIVISDLRNPFYPPLVESLTRGLQEVGLQCLLFNVTPGTNIEEQMAALRQYYVDSIVIVAATVLSETELAHATKGRAAVLVNRVVDNAGFACVACDNRLGAAAVAEHFYDIGRKRCAFVAGLEGTRTGLTRQAGFVTGLAEHGLSLSKVVIGGTYSYEAGYRAAEEIIRTSKTDAIFFANDVLALGGIDALRRHGLSLPEDMAVAGFDNIPMASWPHYDLTTYRQPLDAITETVVGLLSNPDDDSGSLSGIYQIESDLVIRGSTVTATMPGGTG